MVGVEGRHHGFKKRGHVFRNYQKLPTRYSTKNIVVAIYRKNPTKKSCKKTKAARIQLIYHFKVILVTMMRKILPSKRSHKKTMAGTQLKFIFPLKMILAKIMRSLILLV